MLPLQGETEELKHWDMTFWAERLRESKYNITDEELRPYFALPNVLQVRSAAPAAASTCLPDGSETALTWHHQPPAH